MYAKSVKLIHIITSKALNGEQGTHHTTLSQKDVGPKIIKDLQST